MPISHVIVVCGHAVYLGAHNAHPEEAVLDENWYLQSFQNGEPPYYVSHIREGVKLAAEDKNALLIFSGGQSRPGCVISEAQGYFQIASIFNFWGCENVKERTTTEEFACDSYDNILFSIARFVEFTSRFPEKLTVISWKFKEDRFQFFRWALRWPSSQFRFVGVGVPEDIESAEAAEKKMMSLFLEDVTGHGSTGGPLGRKKASRNPHRRVHGYAALSPAMGVVLNWKQAKRIPEGCVPWPES